MARIRLPIQEAVRDLTGDLLGRGTAVDKTSDPLEIEDIGALAAYRDDDGAVQVVLLADQALVLALGGALVMVPEAVIHEIERRGAIPENLYENYWEVANILASLLNRSGSVHVALADCVPGTWDDVADDVKALVTAPGRQRWFSVTVIGYGDGRMGFVTPT